MMFKIVKFQRYHTYISSVHQNFQRSVVTIGCQKNYTPVQYFSNVRVKMPSSSFGGKEILNQFRTWSASLSEESEVLETNEIDKTKPIDPSKDRTKIIPPETSIRYMKSEAYQTTYGDEAVWIKYRRNFKGQFAPKKTRGKCIVRGVIATGNPCPICRDEYLVLHYTNVDLLKQFICPETGEIYDTRKTNICRQKLLELEVAVKKAKFYGYITHEIPIREYDYKEYYPQLKE